MTHRPGLCREQRHYAVAQRRAHATPVYVYRRRRSGWLARSLLALCRAVVRAAKRLRLLNHAGRRAA
jgi:hypothetical protein